MARIEQFSIAPEFNDIIPVLEEWTYGTPEGQKSAYTGQRIYPKSKSKEICMAIRMHVNSTREYLEFMYKEGRTEEDDKKLDKMMAERRKLTAPLTKTTTPTTTTTTTTTSQEETAAATAAEEIVS